MDHVLVTIILVMFAVGMICNSLVLHTFRSMACCNGRVLFSHLCVTDILTVLSQVTNKTLGVGTGWSALNC